MPLGTVLDLGPGHTVLDGAQHPHRKGHSSPPSFRPCLLLPNDRPSQLLLSSCQKCSRVVAYAQILSMCVFHFRSLVMWIANSLS